MVQGLQVDLRVDDKYFCTIEMMMMIVYNVRIYDELYSMLESKYWYFDSIMDIIFSFVQVRAHMVQGL